MKTIFGALALIIAAPVAAQIAPADPHAGHSQQQHQQQGQPGTGHGEHKMDCCKDGKTMECCDKAKQQGQKMDCCGEHGEGHGAGQSGHGTSH